MVHRQLAFPGGLCIVPVPNNNNQYHNNNNDDQLHHLWISDGENHRIQIWDT